jgi:hypothetical protein
MAEFSTGVTTLLARMDTNPSEFFDGGYKWSFLTAQWVKDVLTEAEEAALNNKLTEVRRIAFDQMVMQTLLDSEAEGDSRLGRATAQKGKITNMAHPSQMALQGSSLMSSVYASANAQNAMAGITSATYPYANGVWSEATSGGTK